MACRANLVASPLLAVTRDAAGQGFPSLPGRASSRRASMPSSTPAPERDTGSEPRLSYSLSVSQPSSDSSSAGSLGRTIAAILILLVVGYFLLHILIGVAVAIAGFAVVILAVVAIIWALRVLL